jgi:hypothetical protein
MFDKLLHKHNVLRKRISWFSIEITFIKLRIISKGLLKSARWKCLVDLYINTMCLQMVLSPWFGVETTFIKLRIVWKGLFKSVRWECLVDLYISTICLESVVNPCFGIWVTLTNLVFYFNAFNDENMWLVEGKFVLGNLVMSPCYLHFNNLKWLNTKVITFLYF